MTQEEFFKRYTFSIRTDKIGGGSFGVVYKAYDNTHHEQVAIKVAEVQTISGKEFSLKSEIDTAKSVPDHPNIALYKKVYQFEMQNGIFDYAIMKYYPEGNLKSVLINDQLNIEQKKSIAQQLIEGVKHLHSNGVLHRDLKPANILIHRRGDKYIPIIADFGLSKLTSSGGSRISNSFGGGTLEYSAPEQLLGKELRYNADLWALGVIIYELFTGKRPFVASNNQSSAEAQRQEIFNKIINASLPSDIESLPPPYNEFVRLSLEKDAEKRMVKPKNKVSTIEVNRLEKTIINTKNKPIYFPKIEDESTYINSKNHDELESKTKTKKWLMLAVTLLLILSSIGYVIFTNFDNIISFGNTFFSRNIGSPEVTVDSNVSCNSLISKANSFFDDSSQFIMESNCSINESFGNKILGVSKNLLKCYDLSTNKEIFSFYKPDDFEIDLFQVSKNNKYVALAAANSYNILIYRVDNGEVVCKTKGYGYVVHLQWINENELEFSESDKNQYRVDVTLCESSFLGKLTKKWFGNSPEYSFKDYRIKYIAPNNKSRNYLNVRAKGREYNIKNTKSSNGHSKDLHFYPNQDVVVAYGFEEAHVYSLIKKEHLHSIKYKNKYVDKCFFQDSSNLVYLLDFDKNYNPDYSSLKSIELIDVIQNGSIKTLKFENQPNYESILDIRHGRLLVGNNGKLECINLNDFELVKNKLNFKSKEEIETEFKSKEKNYFNRLLLEAKQKGFDPSNLQPRFDKEVAKFIKDNEMDPIQIQTFLETLSSLKNNEIPKSSDMKRLTERYLEKYIND